MPEYPIWRPAGGLASCQERSRVMSGGLDRAPRHGDPDYVPQEEAAEILGVTVRTVQRMVADGRIQTGEVGTKRYITRGPLLEFARERAQESGGHAGELTFDSPESPDAPETDESATGGDWLDDTLLLPLPASPEPDEPLAPPMQTAGHPEEPAARPSVRSRFRSRRSLLAATLMLLTALAIALPLTMRSEPQLGPVDATPAPELQATRPDEPAPAPPPAQAPQRSPAAPAAANTQTDTSPAQSATATPLRSVPPVTAPEVGHERADGPAAEPEPTAKAVPTVAPSSPSPPTATVPPRANPAPTPAPPTASKPAKGPGDNVCRAMGLCP